MDIATTLTYCDGNNTERGALMRIGRGLLKGGSLVTAIIGIVALTVSPAAGEPAGPTSYKTSPPPSPTATAHEQYVVALRKSLGLNSSLIDVRSINAANRVNPAIGIALSPMETNELGRRQALGHVAERVEQQFATDTSYAGTWLDQSAGGVLHVAFTTPKNQQRATKLNSEKTSDQAIVYSTVKHSAKQLQAASVRILKDLQTDGLFLSAVNSIGIDIPTNTVQINIVDDTPAAIESSLRSMYGDLVSVEHSRRFTTQSSRDIRTGVVEGGEWIRNNASSSECTMGFANLKNSLGQYYTVTAGHCGANGEAFYQGFSKGGPQIGTVHSSTKGSTITDCDCAAIGPVSDSLRNSLYLSNGNVGVVLTKVGLPTYVGQLVCQDGANSYEHIGSVPCGTYQGVNVCNVGFTLQSAILVHNIYSLSGDSGAPLVSTDSNNKPSSTFHGILSGGSGSGAGSQECFSGYAQIAKRYSASFILG